MLGAELLDRSARGVELTEPGRLLVDRGRIIFDELRQCVRDIEDLADPTRGQVRVGTTAPMTVFLSEVIGHMSPRYPGISYTIEVSDSKSLLRSLRQRELDIVITRWMITEPEDLAAELLFEAPLAVLADRRHPLANRENLDLADLMTETWVLPPPDGFLGRIIMEIFRRRGLPCPPALVTTISVYMQLNLVAGGRFLAMLPARMARYKANLGWLRTLQVDLSDSADPVAAVTIAGRRLAGPVALLQKACREVAALR
jgi:DNA-binding transcriptional LysR family regulator